MNKDLWWAKHKIATIIICIIGVAGAITAIAALYNISVTYNPAPTNSQNGSATNGITYDYDVLDRIKTVTKPDGQVVYTYYDDMNQVAERNERNYITTTTYESYGDPDEKRLMKVEDAGQGTTTYTYTSKGDLTGVTMTGGITRTFTYNDKQFLETETHPEMDSNGSGVSITYTYDAVGNMLSRTDARGTTSYTYNSHDKLETIDYPGGNSPDANYTYQTGCENIQTLANNWVTYTFGYDYDDKLNSKTYTINNTAYAFGFTYNDLRNIKTITYPDQLVVTYGYYSDDARINSITAVKSSAGINDSPVTSIAYHPSGKIAQITYGNGVTTTTTYDLNERPETILAGPSNGVTNLAYTYDGCSNVLSITDNRTAFNSITIDSATGYDSLNRLKSASGQWGSVSFDYYYNGNRKTQTRGSSTTTYNYNTANRLMSLTGASSRSFDYDPSGNMTLNGPDTYLYDYANRITLVSGQNTAEYRYDGAGNRIMHLASGTTKLYHYGLDNTVLSETNGSGTVMTDYVYLGSRLINKYEWDVQ